MSTPRSWGQDTNQDSKERFMMLTNYPKQPTQQEMDHLYETHKVDHSIIAVLERHHCPVLNNRTYSNAYSVEHLRVASQPSNPASYLLKKDEQKVRGDVINMKPDQIDEVEEVTITAVDNLVSSFEIQSRNKPCLIMSYKAFLDLNRSALYGPHIKDFNDFYAKHTNHILGCPVFFVNDIERSEIMVFGRHTIHYSNTIPESFSKEATFGGAEIYKFGPHRVEIFRKITNLDGDTLVKVNTQVVLHSNFGLDPKEESMIWKMVAKS